MAHKKMPSIKTIVTFVVIYLLTWGKLDCMCKRPLLIKEGLLCVVLLKTAMYKVLFCLFSLLTFPAT